MRHIRLFLVWSALVVTVAARAEDPSPPNGGRAEQAFRTAGAVGWGSRRRHRRTKGWYGWAAPSVRKQAALSERPVDRCSIGTPSKTNSLAAADRPRYDPST